MMFITKREHLRILGNERESNTNALNWAREERVVLGKEVEALRRALGYERELHADRSGCLLEAINRSEAEIKGQQEIITALGLELDETRQGLDAVCKENDELFGLVQDQYELIEALDELLTEAESAGCKCKKGKKK